MTQVNSIDSLKQVELSEEAEDDESLTIDKEAEHILNDKPWLRSGTDDLSRSPTFERLDSLSKIRASSSQQELNSRNCGLPVPSRTTQIQKAETKRVNVERKPTVPMPTSTGTSNTNLTTTKSLAKSVLVVYESNV